MEKRVLLHGFSDLIHTIGKRVSFHNHLASLIAAKAMYYGFFHGNDRKEYIQQVFRDFDGKEVVDWTQDRKAIQDILYSRVYYAIQYTEYYLYGMNRSNKDQNRSFVGWKELEHYYMLLNKTGRPEVFEHKEKTYEVFKDFFCREQFYIQSEKESDGFISFLNRNPDCILKPTENYGGIGIEIIHAADHQPEELWEKYKKRCPFVLEELIEQAPEMNVFYPHAVNTIRYNTFFHNNKLTRMQAVFRTGRGGSVVDNATSGGIYALVDTETGRILGPARSDYMELFEQHPDTGAQFEGNYIPHWDELNALLEKVVRVVPEQKQVGWDFALSKDGWVMVEGNTTPALQSFDLDHGMRDLISSTFGQVVPMWDKSKK